MLNPNATHWCISSGRNPDGTQGFGPNAFGPFCKEDELVEWWRCRNEPSLGWAPTVEEAWARWETQMNEWRNQALAQAKRLGDTLAAVRASRIQYDSCK